MNRILIFDTYYPAALEAIVAPVRGKLDYDGLLDHVLKASFGTSDFVSWSLRVLHWVVDDVIANCAELTARCGANPWERALVDDADVVFMQDLSLFAPGQLAELRRRRLLVGQLSCPWPGDEYVSQFDVIFTSFPHYVGRIAALGPRAEFLKLAFELDVWQRLRDTASMEERVYQTGHESRPWPASFVGGFGRHWHNGPRDFEVLAREVPEFRWWGYGVDDLPEDCAALRNAHMGSAWGLDMYRIYSDSKIVVNRHGEVAERSGNNLRQYEATGMGAMLVTDCVGPTDGWFGLPTENFIAGAECIVYPAGDGKALADIVKHYLEFSDKRERIAKCGHERTMRDHTYDARAEVIDRVLREELRGKAR